jgi:hypothetical protein
MTAREIAASLTKAQAWALDVIAQGKASSPAMLGWAMEDRPGFKRAYETRLSLKAQGAGRLGGTMMWRLERMGLCRREGLHSRRAIATPLGLAVRAALQEIER